MTTEAMSDQIGKEYEEWVAKYRKEYEGFAPCDMRRAYHAARSKGAAEVREAALEEALVIARTCDTIEGCRAILERALKGRQPL